MKMIVFMRVVVYLVLLLNANVEEALALSMEQNYHSGGDELVGATKLWDQQPKRMERRGESKKVSSLWMAQDYSVPRKRRPVHNDFQP